MLTIALAASAALAVDAQSLADIAKAEAARRATAPPATVLNNSSLPSEPVPTPEITTTYDRIGNYTVVAADQFDLGGLKLRVSFFYPGGVLRTPEEVSFHFSRSATTWQYLTYRPVTVLLDDTTRLDLGKASHDGSVHRGSVLEQMFVKVHTVNFMQIAQAKKVEGRIGTTDFQLTPAQVAALRALVRRMDPNRK